MIEQRYAYAFALIVLLVWSCIWLEREYFINIEDVDFYVITMGNEDRLQNIQTQLKRMNENAETYNVVIHHVDAVVGKTLDLDELIRDGVLTPAIYEPEGTEFNANLENRKNEVGCSLSHLKTYRTILEASKPTKFSVIFEDDFNVSPAFLDKLDELLETILRQNIEFDVLMLSILGNIGSQVHGQIYEISCETPKSCYYAHAYIVNNKNIAKVVDAMKYIDTIADVQLFVRNKEGRLRVLRTETDLVSQNSTYTTIRNN